MLLNQLKIIKKDKRTFLRNKKGIISFFDQEMSAETLCNLIKIKSIYTRSKSILFDRHQLSEKEEIKFNLRFQKYLETLINRMDDQNIDVLLEYLVRIYNIDTFNQEELLFLLLPYERYEDQIVKLSNKMKYPIKSYTLEAICRFFIHDNDNFLLFVKYFKHFNKLRDFLIKSLLGISKIMKNSKKNFLNEFLEIFERLNDFSEKTFIIEICANLKQYFNSKDFKTELKKSLNIDFDEEVKKKECKESKIFCKSRFSGSVKELKEWFENCRERKVSVFDESEINFIESVLFGKNQLNIKLKEVSNLISQIKDRQYLYNKFIALNLLDQFKEIMSDQDLEIYYKNYDNFNVTDLNETNYKLIAHKINKNEYEILKKCLEFNNFDEKVFENVDSQIIKKLVSLKTSKIAKINICKLIDKKEMEITDVLDSEQYFDPVYIKQITLKTNDKSLMNQIWKEIQQNFNAEIFYNLILSVLRIKYKELSLEIVDWAIKNGKMQEAVVIVERFDFFNGDLIRKYVIECNSIILYKKYLEKLPGKKLELLKKLYKENKIELLNKIADLDGIRNILPDSYVDDDILNVLNRYNLGEKDQNAYLLYLVDHMANKKALSLLLPHCNSLIFYRNHKNWKLIKILLMEFLKTEIDCKQIVLINIIKHLEYFDENDEDLIKILFLDGNIFVTQEELTAVIKDSKFCAILLDHLLKKCFAEEKMLKNAVNISLIPKMTPILIKYNQESVEMIFKTYPKIAGLYSNLLLKEFPEKHSLLLNLDINLAFKAAISEKCDGLILKLSSKNELVTEKTLELIKNYVSNCISTQKRELSTSLLSFVCKLHSNSLYMFEIAFYQLFLQSHSSFYTVFDKFSKKILQKAGLENIFNVIYQEIKNDQFKNIRFIEEYVRFVDINEEMLVNIVKILLLSRKKEVILILSRIFNEQCNEIIFNFILNDLQDKMEVEFNLNLLLSKDKSSINKKKILKFTQNFIENDFYSELARKVYEKYQF
ncbi:hypothetical protein NUSPORA_00073 [Nucleospora cyclopteri]